MYRRIIEKINEEIMNTKVNLTYKEFVDLLKEVQEKDEKIKEYKEYILNKEGIHLLEDEKLLKKENKLPFNIRFQKDSFKISELEENIWYTSQYKDNEFRYKVIRYKDQNFNDFTNFIDKKVYVNNKEKEYFMILIDKL